MTQKVFTTDEKAKLKAFINEGVGIVGDIEALRGGLNDTAKDLAEELEIKPALLKKAIRVAAKAELERKRDEFDELEHILDAVGIS